MDIDTMMETLPDLFSEEELRDLNINETEACNLIYDRLECHGDGTWFIYENKYECEDCGSIWADRWESTCDDDCPECGKRHISPYESEDLLCLAVANIKKELYSKPKKMIKGLANYLKAIL